MLLCALKNHKKIKMTRPSKTESLAIIQELIVKFDRFINFVSEEKIKMIESK